MGDLHQLALCEKREQDSRIELHETITEVLSWSGHGVYILKML
jgi:hypothetical protein